MTPSVKATKEFVLTHYREKWEEIFDVNGKLRKKYDPRLKNIIYSIIKNSKIYEGKKNFNNYRRLVSQEDDPKNVSEFSSLFFSRNNEEPKNYIFTLVELKPDDSQENYEERLQNKIVEKFWENIRDGKSYEVRNLRPIEKYGNFSNFEYKISDYTDYYYKEALNTLNNKKRLITNKYLLNDSSLAELNDDLMKILKESFLPFLSIIENVYVKNSAVPNSPRRFIDAIKIYGFEDLEKINKFDNDYNRDKEGRELIPLEINSPLFEFLKDYKKEEN